MRNFSSKITHIAPKFLPEQTQLLINGQFINSVSGETFGTIDPRTEEVIDLFSKANEEDVNKAVMASRKAFDEGPWPRMSGYERGRILNKIGESIFEHKERLANLETLDNGKPLFFSSVADIPLSAQHFQYYGGWADKIHGSTLTHDSAFGKHFVQTLKEPIGVTGQIIPWNFPMLMAAWKLGPSLACGNTVVLKPSEKTPITSLALGKIMLESGLPEGVVNIIPGDGRTGEDLVRHPLIDKVAFTGSLNTAKKIQKEIGIVPFTTELGGKSPAIVFPDADIQTAVDLTHWGLFFNQGQCCCAGSRVFVHESIYDEFLEKSIKAAKNRKVGDPFTEVDQGPQIDKLQFDRIMGYISRAKEMGIEPVVGGSRVSQTGFYLSPTIFADLPDSSEIQEQEIFGPVMGISKWSKEDEIINRANNSNFGLAAGIFSNDVHTINRVSRRLKAGTVWINCYNNFDSATPFGGYKDSGVGREKGYEGLKNYLQTKTVIQPLQGELGWYR